MTFLRMPGKVLPGFSVLPGTRTEGKSPEASQVPAWPQISYMASSRSFGLIVLVHKIKGLEGWKDPLEEEMATHSSILAWRSPQTEEPGE